VQVESFVLRNPPDRKAPNVEQNQKNKHPTITFKKLTEKLDQCSRIRYLCFVNRTISTYGKYLFDFYSKLDEEVQAKIDYVFELVKSLDVIPERFFQHLDDRLFESRI
jgi:hypothetical protein